MRLISSTVDKMHKFVFVVLLSMMLVAAVNVNAEPEDNEIRVERASNGEVFKMTYVYLNSSSKDTLWCTPIGTTLVSQLVYCIVAYRAHPALVKRSSDSVRAFLY